MSGTLYVIGAGPGDPDLLTLKAVRILRGISCLCVPKAREEGSSLALSIIKGIVDLKDKELIEAVFPMVKTRAEVQKCKGAKWEEGQSEEARRHGSAAACSDDLDERWNETALKIVKRLNHGIDVAFVTLGDPAVYSTYFYLHDRLLSLNPRLRIEIVPGISSINAAAAKAGISLGLADERVAVLPATYAGDLKQVLAAFDTVVLMKVHNVFGEVVKNLHEAGVIDSSIYISKAGMPEESVITNLNDVTKEDLNYFSLVIIRRQGKR